MEPTEPPAKTDDESSDVGQDVGDGNVERFDDENWDCDDSRDKVQPDANATADNADLKQEASLPSTVSPFIDSDIAAAGNDFAEKASVDNGEGAAAESTSQPTGTNGWGIGSTLTAFAGALQQDVKEISDSMKNAIQHVKEEFQGSPESFHGLEPARPEGLVALDRSPFDDDEFQNGLEAIDEQVDQLASAAGKALGSFWTGLGGALNSGMQAASNIAGQIETAAAQAASRVSETTKEHAPWSGRSGGGRTSTGGTLVLPPGGLVEDEWQVVDLLGSPSTSVAASFEQLFKLYRGPRFIDDLEAIGNEAARSCNRVRAGLPDDKRDELDAIVARTSAFINLIATIPPTSDCHSAARALTQDTPPSSTPGSAAAAAAKGGPREALVVMCGAAVQRAGTMAEGVSFETHEAAWEGLCRLRAEGLKLLAEFTALSVQHAAFLAMCLEGGDAAAAELDFSADGRNKGAVVRAVLLQLLSDADAIYSAFHAALVTATTSDAFASLAAADGGSPEDALEAAAAAGAGEGEGAAGGASGQAPRAAAQRDLRAVAKELKRGLDVGVSAAMDRILQLRAQDSIFYGEAAEAGGSEAGTPSGPGEAAEPEAGTKAGQGVSADGITVNEGSGLAAAEGGQDDGGQKDAGNAGDTDDAGDADAGSGAPAEEVVTSSTAEEVSS